MESLKLTHTENPSEISSPDEEVRPGRSLVGKPALIDRMR